MRKHLLEYDDVMNKQRQLIYSIRKDILFGKDFNEHISKLTDDIYVEIFDFYIDNNKDPSDWDFTSLQKEILAQYGLNIDQIITEDLQNIPYTELKENLLKQLKEIYQEKENLIGSDQLRELERMIMLQIIDSQWKDHLLNIDHLKEGIGLRGYAQKDPLIEYKKESYDLFQSLQNRIDEEVIKFLFLFHPVEEDEIENWRKKKKSKLLKPTSKLPGRRRKKKKRRR